MLVSKYIAKFLAENQIKYVFGITGTAVNMCFVGLGEEEGIDYVCPMHEQGASMGADGYSRVGRHLGVAIGTSGPGATNMVTGCAGAYTDSVPVLFIVGQAMQSTRADNNTRFFAFQEIDLVSIFKPITKYVNEVTDQKQIKYELGKAMSIALRGRKGPCVLVIPEDILYADIDPDKLPKYEDECKQGEYEENIESIRKACGFIVSKLKKAKKPILLFGGGVHQSCAEEDALNVIHKLSCPTALTFPARDLLGDDSKYNIGSIGIFGTIAGNKMIQNSDYIISIGARLDRYITGNPPDFAKNAYKVVVDIDENELNKFDVLGPHVDYKIMADIKVFLKIFLEEIKKEKISVKESYVQEALHLRKQYPLLKSSYAIEDTVNPYYFVDRLSFALRNDDIIFTDTGLSAIWIGQSFKFKQGQRWHTQFAYSAMGYSLPAAIGGYFAVKKRVICIAGDGGLQMSIQELCNLEYYRPDIKVFVICNDGYGLIQKTQDDFKNGHHATDRKHHVPLPDIIQVANAYKIPTFEISNNKEIDEALTKILNVDGPVLCAVKIPISKRISLRVRGGDLDNMIGE